MYDNKIYKYALSLTSQFYFCGIPFRLDTTPKCTLNCLYCFAMSRGGRRTSQKLIANPRYILDKLLISSTNNEQYTDITRNILSRRVPVHFGGVSDPFSNSLIATISNEMLVFLSNHSYPVVISTKNTDLIIKDDTMKVLTEMKKLVIQISFTSLDIEKTKLIEPNVPSILKRLQCIEHLTKSGIYVIARLQPLFPCYETNALEDLISKLGNSGCKHVVIEYLKLPVEKSLSLIKNMFDIMKWDGYAFYQKNGAKLIGREWILPNEFKWEKLQPLIKCIHECGMTYGSGDYGLNHMGDTDCCCGIDRLPGFNNWFKGNFSNIIKKTDSKYLNIDCLNDNWFPEGSIKRYINSNCRLNGANDVLSYLQKKWNSPGTVNAPDSFLGVSWIGDRDKDGNCIYYKGVICKK